MTQSKAPPHLILNSPYEEPGGHWEYQRETRKFVPRRGRRGAGYLVATPGARDFDDPGEFRAIELANEIRGRVGAWRGAGWPGVSSATRDLLSHWTDPEREQHRRFFFCQMEAIETLVWLTEAAESERTGIAIPSDGGEFQRLCAKMATGTGKTVVMAMAIAWHILNKVAYPQDARFSKNVFVVAPGLTVKSRLQVLLPAAEGNYYEEFDIVPRGMMDKLRRGKVLVRNWHALNWETEERAARRRSVDKRGARSDDAYVRDVLGELSRAQRLLVINDEAHHAWRVSPGAAPVAASREEIEEATKWIGGLDRIHRSRGILACYDFSATPMMPSGKRNSEEALFGWIVSDFGLSDAIESGLVKTPRVVVRDDAPPSAKTYKSRLYHIYPEVKDDLNRRADPEERLPDLVLNAYTLLGYDWKKTLELWKSRNDPTPPVMITVTNRTETAARIRYAFEKKHVKIDELSDMRRVLHIDSKVLAKAESREESGSKKEQAESLRQQVDTVGKPGKPGGPIQNVISVGMLSEGWDAKTVTHIMGLRAFSSQLLCEQVVGRGLRRTAYDLNENGLFDPEFVNIFGVPFSFMPHEFVEGAQAPLSMNKTEVKPVDEKKEFEIQWPNVIRIDRILHPQLRVNWDEVQPLELDTSETRNIANLAPVVDGKPNVEQIKQISLENLAREYRLQRIIFETAVDLYEQMKSEWKADKGLLVGQLAGLVEEFLRSDRIHITPALFHQNELRRRLMFLHNMTAIGQHIKHAIFLENTERAAPVFDPERPIGSTGDMRPWFTGKPCEHTQRSHINFCVYDSTWEAAESFQIENSPNVRAWVKNDHLGFEILYIYGGIVRKYRPDFLIRLASDEMLILEVKGQETGQDRAKHAAAEEWVQAVTAHGGFGRWRFAVSYASADLADLLG